MDADTRPDPTYELLKRDGAVPIKSWTRGVPFELAAKTQLQHISSLPFIHKWVAVMPDVHLGKGATVGSVIPTHRAIIPAAVGVDIGCGMMAVKTSLPARALPDNLHALRTAVEAAVPHGRTDHGGRNDRGAWANPPAAQVEAWSRLKSGYEAIIAKHPQLNRGSHVTHLGTLGTGSHFIELAKEDMRRFFVNLPDKDLAYLSEGTEHFDDYVAAVHWAQDYAKTNRDLMMQSVIESVRATGLVPAFDASLEAVNCHHNYVAREHHYGEDVFVTRKGAVRARKGDLGIIPGSMGTRSYIVRGLGNPESFDSCSHGAGRAMSRTEAKRRFTIDDHITATSGVECRKDAEVIDETPGAYKPIDAVMHAQRDLVEVVHTLRQVVCVKG